MKLLFANPSHIEKTDKDCKVENKNKILNNKHVYSSNTHSK